MCLKICVEEDLEDFSRVVPLEGHRKSEHCQLVYTLNKHIPGRHCMSGACSLGLCGMGNS